MEHGGPPVHALRVLLPAAALSDRQVEQVAKILSCARAHTQDLNAWNLTLTCGHVVRRTQHHDHDRYAIRVTDCPDCGGSRGVVTSERTGLADKPGQATEDRLAAALAAAKAKLDRQRAAIQASERAVADSSEKLNNARK